MSEEIETQDQEQELAAPAADAEAEVESGDEAEQNLEESATSEGEQVEGQPKKKGGFQRKLDREVKKRGDVERERDFLRQELHKALGTHQPEGKAEQKVEATASQPEPEPKLKDFNDWDEYMSAQRKWMLKEAERIAEAKVSDVEKRRTDADQKRKESDEAKRLNEAFNEREEKASKKYKDWEEVAGNGDDPTVFVELTALKAGGKAPSVEYIAAVLGSADPEGDLEYYLAQNLDEVERIAKLPQLQASIELGKLLGTKLAPQESPAPKASAAAAASKALPPPRTLGKTSPTSTGNLADIKDDAEYFRKREAQEIERQRKGRKR